MKNLRILALVPLPALFFYVLCRPPAKIHAAPAATSQDPPAFTVPGTATETWSHAIAPLLYKNCTTCHHPGGAGPFSLLTYADARRWAPQILIVTQSRFMPPWLPEPGYGDFADVRRLTDEEQALLKRWIKGGMPEGDLAAAPAPPHYDTAWQLGKPDLILETAKPFTLPAGGTDVFRNLIMPYPLKETHYVRAMEIRPNPPRVVHHANLLIDRTGSLRRAHPADWQGGVPGMELLMDAGNRFDPDSHFLFWKPDTPALVEPEGMPWRLDPGNDLVLNTHMKPSGKPETVTAQVGLYFTKDPPVHLPMLLQLDGDDQLDIPAGDVSFVVQDSLKLPVDVEVLGVYPHAHYLGRDLEGWAILPNGEKKWLVWIKDWDINRQSVYHYRQPVQLPAGTVLHMKYTYDNSPDNPHNPDSPPVRVRAGNRSTDEMSHLWLQVLPVNTPANAPDPRLLLEEAWMRNRLAKSPRDRVSLYNLAAALAGEGKFTAAAQAYEQELKLEPSNARTLTALGAALEGAGQLEQARQRYQSAIAIASPADFGGCDARFDLARLAVRQAQYAEAEKEFRALLAACPEDAETRSGLGAALLGAGSTDEAAKEFRRALELDAGDFTALYNLGVIAAGANQPDQAVKLLQSALRAWPASPDAHEKLAAAYAQTGRMSDALAELRSAASLAPNDAQVHSSLSQVLDAQGQSEEAFAEQKRALELDPQDADGWNNLGALLARGGQTAAARAAFEHALQIQPGHAQAKANLARLAAGK
ncbi:MAG TPA: tetratricopeptide repeat protein [Terracidiphilus sp.]|jgi:Flp pilus assembly protein TadD/mono/diheme cytochrome c family protein